MRIVQYSYTIAVSKTAWIAFRIVSASIIFSWLGSSSYNLFVTRKKWSNEEIITEFEAYFEGLDKSYNKKHMKMLEQEWF